MPLRCTSIQIYTIRASKGRVNDFSSLVSVDPVLPESITRNRLLSNQTVDTHLIIKNGYIFVTLLTCDDLLLFGISAQ